MAKVRFRLFESPDCVLNRSTHVEVHFTNTFKGLLTFPLPQTVNRECVVATRWYIHPSGYKLLIIDPFHFLNLSLIRDIKFSSDSHDLSYIITVDLPNRLTAVVATVAP